MYDETTYDLMKHVLLCMVFFLMPLVIIMNYNNCNYINKIIIYFDSTLRNREGVRFEMLEGLNREKRRLSRKGDNG